MKILHGSDFLCLYPYTKPVAVSKEGLSCVDILCCGAGGLLFVSEREAQKVREVSTADFGLSHSKNPVCTEQHSSVWHYGKSCSTTLTSNGQMWY